MKFNPFNEAWEFNPNKKYWIVWNGVLRYTTVFNNTNYAEELKNGDLSFSKGISVAFKGYGCDFIRGIHMITDDRKTAIKIYISDLQSRIKYYNKGYLLQKKLDKATKTFPEYAI